MTITGPLQRILSEVAQKNAARTLSCIDPSSKAIDLCVYCGAPAEARDIGYEGCLGRRGGVSITQLM